MRNHVFRLIVAIVMAALLPACGSNGGGTPPVTTVCGGGGTPPVTTTCVDRTALCAEALLNDTATLCVNNLFYTPEGAAGAAGAALHGFMGTLDISATTMSVSSGETTGRTTFPRVSVQFMTIGDTLFPLDRNVIPGGRQDTWDIILSPGKVWSEPTDQGMSRASFPFTLVTNQWNEAHNGIATFLFDDARVSNVHFQVLQETASWNKADLWGAALAAYLPDVIANAAQIEQDFVDELGARVDVKTWAELASDYPGADVSAFTRTISLSDISATGIVVDNTFYFHSAMLMRPGKTS